MNNIFKSKAFQIISYIFFLALGVGLLYMAFRNQDFVDIKNALLSANIYWILPVILFNIIGSALRAWRWKILMKSAGYESAFLPTYTTLMLGYFVSIAIPRLGEITRCLTLQKKENIPFTASFGTVMAERLIDIFMLLVCIGAAFILTYEELGIFFNSKIFVPVYTLFKEKFLDNPKAWVLVCVLLGLVLYMLKSNKQNMESKMDTIDRYVQEIWNGMRSMFNVTNYGLFVAVTFFIWVSYFLTSYFWLFSFDETAKFGFKEGLAVMAIGTIGRSVPIQGGGMGAYHFLVSQGLSVFGVNLSIATAYAILNHGVGTLFQISVGTLSGLYLLFVPNGSQRVSDTEGSTLGVSEEFSTG